MLARAHEARASGASYLRKFGNLSIRETDNHVDRTSSPQGNHCGMSNFLAVWEPVTCVQLDDRRRYYGQLTADNGGSGDQSHMTISWTQVPSHGGHVFLKLSAHQLLVLLDRGL